MNNKNGFLFGENIVQLLLAVVVSIFLIMVGVAVYHSFVPSSETEAAHKTLQSLISRLEELNESNPNGTYLALNLPKQFLYSTETGELCNGKYCLCMCDLNQCDDIKENGYRICFGTDKFVAFDGGETYGGAHSQVMKVTGLKVVNLNLNYIPGKVYSYNVFDRLPLDPEDPFYVAYYYRYNQANWEVSTNLASWRVIDPDDNTFAYDRLIPFFKILGTNEEKGRRILEGYVKESDGVYVIST